MEEKSESKPKTIVEIPDFGPLRISGNFVIKDLKNNKEDSAAQAELCICGKSSKKPYCDESHKR